MGFGTDDSDSTNTSNAVADQQLRDNQVALDAKKQSLFQTRLDIIKSEGGQQWTANRSGGAVLTSGMNNGKPVSLGSNGGFQPVSIQQSGGGAGDIKLF